MNLIAPKPLRFSSRIEQSVVFPTLLWAPVTEITLNDMNTGYRMQDVRCKIHTIRGEISDFIFCCNLCWNNGRIHLNLQGSYVPEEMIISV